MCLCFWKPHSKVVFGLTMGTCGMQMIRMSELKKKEQKLGESRAFFILGMVTWSCKTCLMLSHVVSWFFIYNCWIDWAHFFWGAFLWIDDWKINFDRQDDDHLSIYIYPTLFAQTQPAPSPPRLWTSCLALCSMSLAMPLRRLLSSHHFLALILSLGLKKTNGEEFFGNKHGELPKKDHVFSARILRDHVLSPTSMLNFPPLKKVLNTNYYLMMFFQCFHVFPIWGFFCNIRSWHVLYFPSSKWEDEIQLPINWFLGAMGAKQSCQVINAVIAPFTLGEKLTNRRTRVFELVKGPHGFKTNIIFGRGIPLKPT